MSENLDKAMVGLTRLTPETMPDRMVRALYHTERTHTMMALGKQRRLGDPGGGMDLKIICDSTGGMITVDADDRGRALNYPACRFCGLVFGAKRTVEAEVMFDTNDISAWPALPGLVDEFML